MRVAVNLEQLLSPSPGGVGRYAAKLAVHLVRLGVEVQPFVARHGPAELRSAWQEFALQEVAQPMVLGLPRPVLYDAWHLLGRPPRRWPGDVDLVHAPSLAVPPKGGKPLVVSIHDAAPWLFPEAFPARGRWFHATGARAASRRADRVITGTAAAAQEIAEHLSLPPERVRVVPYGVDPPPPALTAEAVAQVLGRRGLARVPYVLWVGSLEPRKGVGTLVSAMARLGQGGRGAAGCGPPGCGPPPVLVLAGYPGWQNSALLPAAELARLGERFHPVGRVPEAELGALYAGAAVFAFPSRHEGFGLPVLEAMAHGAPVIASDIAPVREVAGEAAVLVAPDDVEAWAAAIGALLADGPRRDDLVQRGRRRAALFSWASTAARTLEVYRELVA